MPRHALSTEHKKHISDSLKEHHKRKRRGKTFLGRIANKLTKSRRDVRKTKVDHINAQIKDMQDNIKELHMDLKKTAGNKMAFFRRRQVRKQIEHLTQQVDQLKLQRKRTRG